MSEFEGVQYDKHLDCCDKAREFQHLLLNDTIGTHFTRNEGPGWYLAYHGDVSYWTKIGFCPWCGVKVP